LITGSRVNRRGTTRHEVHATGTTGALPERSLGFAIRRLQSEPLGGDQQIGARIVSREINFLIFFWDPREPRPHDPGVKAPLRIRVLWPRP